MEINKVTCAYFSVGGTTEKVIREVAAPFSDYATEYIDLTKHEMREDNYYFTEHDLLIVAAPAYFGRIPKPVAAVLEQHFIGEKTPAIVIGTYGNGDIGDIIMELYKILSGHDFVPFGAGEFSCQHTYLSELALGRPDEEDLAIAHEFGEKLKDRLKLLVHYAVKPMDIPGTFPYTHAVPDQIPFKVETNESCFYCMICAGICPMQAISESNPFDINDDVCIRCSACIKACPASAKYFTRTPFEQIQDNLLKPLVGTRKESRYWIG